MLALQRVPLRRHSPETIAKIKASRLGKKHTEETIAKLKLRGRDGRLLPETILKIKATKSNASEEERALLIRRIWGAKLHIYRSEESKEKSRERLREFNRAR